MGEKSKKAAVLLSGGSEKSVSESNELLADIKVIYSIKNIIRISTKT